MLKRKTKYLLFLAQNMVFLLKPKAYLPRQVWHTDAAYEEWKEFTEKFSWIEQKFDLRGFLI